MPNNRITDYDDGEYMSITLEAKQTQRRNDHRIAVLRGLTDEKRDSSCILHG